MHFGGVLWIVKSWLQNQIHKQEHNQVIVSSLANPIDSVIINSQHLLFAYDANAVAFAAAAAAALDLYKMFVACFDYFKKRHTNTKSLISNATYVEQKTVSLAIDLNAMRRAPHILPQTSSIPNGIEFRLLFRHDTRERKGESRASEREAKRMIRIYISRTKCLPNLQLS